MLEIVWDEIFKKNDYKEVTEQHSKLTSNGNHKSNGNCDSYTFKKMKS